MEAGPAPMPIMDTRRGRLRIELKDNPSYTSLVELLRALAQLNVFIDPVPIVLERIAIGLSENVMDLVNTAEKTRASDSPKSRNWIAVQLAGRAAACAKECLDAVAEQRRMSTAIQFLDLGESLAPTSSRSARSDSASTSMKTRDGV